MSSENEQDITIPAVAEVTETETAAPTPIAGFLLTPVAPAIAAAVEQEPKQAFQQAETKPETPRAEPPLVVPAIPPHAPTPAATPATTTPAATPAATTPAAPAPHTVAPPTTAAPTTTTTTAPTKKRNTSKNGTGYGYSTYTAKELGQPPRVKPFITPPRQGKADMLLLKQVLGIQSYRNDNDWQMINYLTDYIVAYADAAHAKVGVNFDQYGNIYVTKGVPPAKRKGQQLDGQDPRTFYPCIVAHIDTVHSIIPYYNFRVIEEEGNLWGWDIEKMDFSGIGGDDKVGVYICLEMLRQLPACKLVFFRDEEGGCNGSKQAIMPFFDDCAFVLQADRNGYNDFIKVSNGAELYSPEFFNAISSTLRKHDYKPCTGSSTDVGMLKLKGLPVSCANISCGYYRFHVAREFVVYEDVETCFQLMLDICKHQSYRQWEHEHEPPKPIVSNWRSDRSTARKYDFQSRKPEYRVTSKYRFDYNRQMWQDLDSKLYITDQEFYIDIKDAGDLSSDNWMPGYEMYDDYDYRDYSNHKNNNPTTRNPLPEVVQSRLPVNERGQPIGPPKNKVEELGNGTSIVTTPEGVSYTRTVLTDPDQPTIKPYTLRNQTGLCPKCATGHCSDFGNGLWCPLCRKFYFNEQIVRMFQQKDKGLAPDPGPLSEPQKTQLEQALRLLREGKLDKRQATIISAIATSVLMDNVVKVKETASGKAKPKGESRAERVARKKEEAEERSRTTAEAAVNKAKGIVAGMRQITGDDSEHVRNSIALYLKQCERCDQPTIAFFDYGYWCDTCTQYFAYLDSPAVMTHQEVVQVARQKGITSGFVVLGDKVYAEKEFNDALIDVSGELIEGMPFTDLEDNLGFRR